MPESKKTVPAGKVPPHNLQAEKAVLCACLDSESARSVVTAILRPDDFYRPNHRIIYQAVLDLMEDRAAVDVITLSDYLESHGHISDAGGLTYLTQLSDMPVIRANAAEYAAIVRQRAMSRRLIASLDELIKLSYDGDQEANNLLDLAIKRLSDMKELPSGYGFESIQQILKRTLQDIVDISKGKKVRNVIHSGFSRLDKVLGGFRPGSLVIVAARPAMGKSAFVINLATNVSTLYAQSVAFFSLEMSKEEIGNRILASKSAVSTYALQSASIHERDWDKISEAMAVLSPAPFFIDDRSGLNTIEMMAKCRQLKNDHKLELVIVDYLQLMTAATPRMGNRQQEISDISRSLKNMAKELNVPVVALSQLSRGAEYRDDRRPLLSDLRDSGAIEQDADVVMFLYRDKYYDTSLEKPDIEDAELILAKNRQGATSTVMLKWWPKRTLFFEEELPSDPVDPYGEAPVDDQAPPVPDASEQVLPEDF